MTAPWTFSTFFLISNFLLFVPSALCRDQEFNPYKTLGLRRTASQKDVKQAYKEMAMKWHPDKNKSPEAEERFMEINQAYKILSTPQRRKTYDTFGFTDEQFEEMRREHYQEHQQHFQYIRWPSPPRKRQTDISQFLLPFGSVLGTLFFIFLVGYLLNHMNEHERNKRRRQPNDNNNNRAADGNNNKEDQQQQQEWHPEDPKTPLTEEERQQRVHQRVWRVMGPLIHELRAETQFGLIRLLKPGCRSIIVLVDRDSKDTLLQQFARHVYCLRNNKTFSFGFLMVPKNLTWFRSLLELTLPDEDQREDSASVSTATTDTDESNEAKKPEKDVETGDKEKKRRGADMTARNKLKEINPKHTLGTVLVICGWKLYFSIYHPMHRPLSIRARIALSELGDEESDGDGQGNKCDAADGINRLKKRASASSRERENAGRTEPLNEANVLNGFPMFLDRLLEGTVRRYYVPEWPDNFV